MKILLVVFLRKNLIWGNLIFIGHFLMFDWSKLSQATVTIEFLNSHDMISFMIVTGSLNSQDMIFQVNVCVMDTLRRYYVMFIFGGQYSTDCHMIFWKGFVKNLSRNFVWM